MENKTSKYFKYAIGEIVLVVIGILIALQINNWNEQRQNQILGKEYLNEIKNNLQYDLSSIERVLAFNKNKDSTIDKIFKIMASKDSIAIKNSKMLPFTAIVTEYQVFLSKNTAFENMTSSYSIKLIEDDSLRDKLSGYYNQTANLNDFTQEQVKLVTRRFIDESIPILIDSKTVEVMTGHKIHIKQTNDFYTDPAAFKNLFNMKMNIIGQNNMLFGLRKKIKDLIQSIDRNLGDNE